MKNLLKNILANSNSWKATEKGDKIIYADEQDPRLIVLWGGYSFAKNIMHLVVTFMQ